MIFTARIDESDTHGSKPDMMMSAMLASAKQWEASQRRLRALKKKYGFSVFHGVDFKHQRGEFANWSASKCVGLLNDFGQLVGYCLTEAVLVSLPYELYKKRFLDARPRKLHATSQYGFCFEAALYTCSKRVLGLRGNHRLSVIVECGHKNAGDTARIFADRKKEWGALDRDFLKTHVLASKDDDELLMLADVLAYGNALERRAIGKGEALPHKDRPTQTVQKNAVGTTIVEVTPEYFDGVIKQFNRQAAAKHDAYLKRSAAWQASKKEAE